MTAREKTTLSRFFDLTDDYLKDGHARPRDDHAFEDDEAAVAEIRAEALAKARAETPTEKPGLPLAYLVEESEDTLDTIAGEIAVCEECGLAAARTNAVPGEGSSQPLVMVIGEGPGADEDAAGRPFVGRAGQLLDRMLESIALSRSENCYIANMVKCRPPGNRDPESEEIAACYPFLERQIALLRPRVILCAGRVAAQNLLKTTQGINALRGEFAEVKCGDASIPVLPTFHPSAVLRDESLKRPAWEDLKLLRARLDSFDGYASDG